MRGIINFLVRLRNYLRYRKIPFDLWKVRYKRESRLRVISKKRALLVFLRQSFTPSWPPRPSKVKLSFLIGPTNSANQGTLWARALTASHLPSQSLRISNDPSSEWFSSDFALTRTQWLEFQKRQDLANLIAESIDIVLIESLRPILRLHNAKDGRSQVIEDLELLKLMGKRIGVVFHGSDIRDTQSHATRNPYSPFHNENEELEKMKLRTRQNAALLPLLREKKIPIFVTTKDLLVDVPDAHWLPVAIDFDRFQHIAITAPIFPDPDAKLRVLFLPSRSWLKSADLIEPVLIKLRDEGVISYHSYLGSGESLQHTEIPKVMAGVDLVIDQYLGVIGVFPLEALAAGRLVMSYIPAEVGEVPIINITPETLESEIRRVATTRPRPVAGVEYVKRWHDGGESVLALAEVFGFQI